MEYRENTHGYEICACFFLPGKKACASSFGPGMEIPKERARGNCIITVSYGRYEK